MCKLINFEKYKFTTLILAFAHIGQGENPCKNEGYELELNAPDIDNGSNGKRGLSKDNTRL